MNGTPPSPSVEQGATAFPPVGGVVTHHHQEECRACSDLPCAMHLPAIREGIGYDGWADAGGAS